MRADLIGGTFDSKLRTSLAGGAYIPDITALNDNVALYFPNEDLFHDLNEFGAEEVRDEFYDWKWSLGTTTSGRFCFWPMDTGPTGFFYRADLFEAAGLPSSPQDVGAAIRTWDDWIDLGVQLRAAEGGSFIIINALSVFQQHINASSERYLDADDKPLFTQPGNAIREAWDVAVRAAKAGATGNLQLVTDQNSAFSSGKVAGHIDGAWWAQVIAETAPDSRGLWRLAPQPELPGNRGGSFMAVPKTCKDPAAAVAFMRWLTTPESQATSYNEMQLFPSAPRSFQLGTMTGGDYFGDQDPLAFFSEAALQVPTTFISTYESQVGAFAVQIANVESAGKDPDTAWNDAVEETLRILAKRGVV
nr:extracellular solute-binding protein [Kineococcus siccus]